MNNQTTSRLSAGLRVTTAVFLALLLGAALPGSVSRVSAQSPTKTTSSSAKGGPKEGIKVHGHWTIEVRNPDGKLVTRREFENELTGEGRKALEFMLTRQYNAGKWAISLDGFKSCMQEDGSDYPVGVPCSKTLRISGPSVILKGSTTAIQDRTISSVQTVNWLCPSTLTAAQCAANNPENTIITFTSFDLKIGTDTPPVTVVEGQSIQVTVVISFS